MYSCGLRIAEATRLSVQQIDSGAMVIRVIGKGDKERLAPLCPGLLDQLRAHWRTHRHPRLVFPNRRGQNPLSSGTVAKAFRAALAEAGIKGHFTPHSLRHYSDPLFTSSESWEWAKRRHLAHSRSE